MTRPHGRDRTAFKLDSPTALGWPEAKQAESVAGVVASLWSRWSW